MTYTTAEHLVPTLDETTFEYLKPTDAQIETMARVRAAAKEFADILERELPDGADKTYVLRNHRTNAMWANVILTLQTDGSARTSVRRSRRPRS